MTIKQGQKYLDDIRDDILENWDSDLYEFIAEDVVKAFWTPFVFKEIVNKEDILEVDQYLLYSKQIRHAGDNILKEYGNQIDFWETKFRKSNKKVLFLDLIDYVLNNLICFKDRDLIDIALYFGNYIYENYNKFEKEIKNCF